MRLTTKSFHERLSELGPRLGLKSEREVSGSLLSLRLDRAYQPRVDLMWSLPLSSAQVGALSHVLGEPISVSSLPLVGIEVEGTTPSTKTLASDVANIAALGTRLGLLVVSEQGEPGIYRRAHRRYELAN